MCRECNEALQAAANSAKLLADAAATLYSINERDASKILAQAAAELFKPAKEEMATSVAGNPGTPGKSEGSIDPAAEARAEINKSLPKGLILGDDDNLYQDGKVIGSAVIIRRPTRH